MNIKNIIFDFDGILVDSKKCSMLTTHQAFCKFGLKEPKKRLIECWMRISIKKMAETELQENSVKKSLKISRRTYKELDHVRQLTMLERLSL
ncbi:HAD hydrolase-like protein [Rummeliibacillus sp. SL167]|uniref:HAD hydrolase-like protein n=1 Tax=Rummeliibacillus sp. SL167 TaxID=2579792 RepID=UPI0011B7C78D|nr:HAD hydrolase-like protein [Rummeliibacillus sp. SL167]